jgi:predicted HicB family RNase H-like nuclease
MIKDNTMKEEALPAKKIHIALSADVHQRLRVKCALEDKSLQTYVEKLIKDVTKDVEIPKREENKRVK